MDLSFRAWDPKEKKMIYSDNLYEGKVRVFRSTGNNTWDQIEGSSLYEPLEHTMQSTGLKDMNGKKAFHKDLFLDEHGELLIIEKDHDGVQWETHLVEGGKIRYPYGTVFKVRRSVIQGNAFENKELMERVK